MTAVVLWAPAVEAQRGANANPAVSRQEQEVAADPVQAVTAALEGEQALQRAAARHRGGVRDWTVSLRTVRGQCYEVIARATGASQVTAEVRARRARVGDAFPLATGSGVARTRFCADLPGRAYSVRVHTEGATWWALALRVAPPLAPTSGDPGAAQRERLAAALAGNTVGGPEGATIVGESSTSSAGSDIPVGGSENDYVGNQIRALMRDRVGVRALIPAIRVNLATNQSREIPLSLTAGRCVELVAVGVPSVLDLDMALSDPAGHRVAEDRGHRPMESIRYCPSYSGTYRLTVRMFSGFGLTGIQAFEVR